MKLARRSLLAGLALPLPALAQSWPDRPVRIIVPYAPGGANDIIARLLAVRFQERLGQPFVVENRPGAQAMIGTRFVADARPDGHTLLVAANGPITVSPAVNPRTPYRTLRDLAPVSMVATAPLVLVVRADAPYRTLPELAAWARANPQRANYGASAASFQLATELLKQHLQADFTYVAYRSSAESVNAVAQGETTIALVDFGPAQAALQAGRVRPLAVSTPQRLAQLPDTPSFVELGLPALQVQVFVGLLAPAGTPAPILARLAEETARAVEHPEMLPRVTGYGMAPAATGTEAFRALITRELELWERVARENNLRFEE
jgi:tripartite-type tricarboxylate transporter receptor subunit TctC